jgi:hypothetical protein
MVKKQAPPSRIEAQIISATTSALRPPMTAGGVRCASAGVVQQRRDLRLRGAPTRRETAEAAGERGHKDSEREQTRIRRDLGCAGEVLRQRGDDQACADEREQQAGEPADRGEKQALGEELAEDAPATGTEGDAERDLLPTCAGAGEQRLATFAQATPSVKTAAATNISSVGRTRRVMISSQGATT